jgi:hypothetical protein
MTTRNIPERFTPGIRERIGTVICEVFHPDASHDLPSLTCTTATAAADAVLQAITVDPPPGNPRVWIDGETVPAGVCVLTRYGQVRYLDDTADCGHFPDGDLCAKCSYDNRNSNLGPLVEVNLPDYWAVVKADRKRREADTT